MAEYDGFVNPSLYLLKGAQRQKYDGITALASATVIEHPPPIMLDGPKGREPRLASEASCKSERAKRVSGRC